MIPILCNCLQSSPTSTYRVVFVFLWTHSQSVSRLCFCVLSFKDNFEVNNEIKDVTETFEAPEHILLIVCGAWGDRMCSYFCFSEFSTAENTWTPFPFWQQAAVWAPASPFPFEVLPCNHPAGSLHIFLPLSLSPLSPPPCLFLQSPQQNVMLWFFCFCFCIVFVLLFGIFSFPTMIMPRKKQGLHVSCCFFTPSYISPSPLCFL